MVNKMIIKMKVMMKIVNTRTKISQTINLIIFLVKNKLKTVTSIMGDNNQVAREVRKKFIVIFMIKMKAIKGLEMNNLLMNRNLIIFKRISMDIKKFVQGFTFKI